MSSSPSSVTWERPRCLDIMFVTSKRRDGERHAVFHVTELTSCHRNISDVSSRCINCVQIIVFSSTIAHQSGCVLLDHNWACFLFTLSRKRIMNPLNLFIRSWEKWHFKSICVNLMCTSPACRWVIYNDHKVCLSERPPKDLGYVYFYHRLSSS